jgi:hypothetical protein
MAHDVFISYSSKDKPTADAACAKLEAREIRCWMAPRDIVPGEDWSSSIVDAINGARAMVLVFSSNANASQQIKREVERAVHKGIPIIPLRIENVVPEKSLEYFISTPHWLDAYTEPLDRHLTYLADVLRHILDGKAVPEPPPPPPPPWWRGPLGIAAGAAALLVIALVAWFAWLRPPPGFTGSWTATALDIRQFTPENAMVGAEIPAQFLTAALKNPSARGVLTVDASGQFTIDIDGEDRGTVSASPSIMSGVSGNTLTFASAITHQNLTVGVLLEGTGSVYDPRYGAPPNGQSVWRMIFMPAGQQGGAGIGTFSGKPSYSGGAGGRPSTIHLIATTWQPTQYTAAPGLNGSDPDNAVTASLRITPAGQYTLTYGLREKGLWNAADGKWTRQVPSGNGFAPPSTDGGTYTFTGRDRVTLFDQYGSSTWQRS